MNLIYLLKKSSFFIKLIIALTILIQSFNLSGQSKITIPLKITELASVGFPIPLDSNLMEFRGVMGSLFTLNSKTLNPSLRDCRNVSLFLFLKDNKRYISQIDLNSENFIWQSRFVKGDYHNLIIDCYECHHQEIIIPVLIDQYDNSLNVMINRGYEGNFFLNDSSYYVKISIFSFVRFVLQINITVEYNNEVVYSDNVNYGESFFFLDNVFLFDTIDLFKQEITLHRLPQQERVIGIRENQYISEFDKMIDPIIRKIDSSDTFNKGNDTHYLFHFWGSWCVPCLREIPYLQRLFAKLNFDQIIPINVALVNSPSNYNRTREMIAEKKLIGLHFLEEIRKKELHFISLLNTTSYPSYVIVSNEGKVLYRSDKVFNKVDLEDFLKLNGFLKDN